MPARIKFLVAALLVLAALTNRPAWAQVPPPAAGPVTYQTFYDALSPYGQWVSDPDYGYVWLPAAGASFQPYQTNGHWVYTDYGWTWVSDYAWGWAPFHYGRWRFADAYGWVWVPGYSWGPAWVAWRQNAGYYGWAPLGPPAARPGVRVNIGFSFSFGDAPVAPARWCFVPAAYVASPSLATYYVPPARTTVVYNQTTVINNTYVNKTVNNTTVVNNQGGRPRGGFPAGPARADVEKATGQQLQPVAVANRSKPGVGVQGQALAFYRPDVKAPEAASVSQADAPAPRRTASLADAARQARTAQPGNGLARPSAVQQLSSTDAQPLRAARQRATAQPAAADAPAAPNTDNASRASRRNQPGGADPATPGTTSTAPDATERQQRKEQRQQARQQAQASGQPTAPTDAQRQQERKQEHQQDPAFQHQRQARPAQQMQEGRQPMREDRMGGGRRN